MNGIWNCALLFNEADSDAFIHYSQYVNSIISSDFCLGQHSLPHLTLLQFEADEMRLGSIWRSLSGVISDRVAVELAGLTLLPSKDGDIWIEIMALKTKVLAGLQNEIIKAVGPTKIHSGVGESYRPHITVARALNSQASPALRLEMDVVRRKGVVGHLSVGVSGANFQYEKAVFRGS